jgi:hypothetical protein
MIQTHALELVIDSFLFDFCFVGGSLCCSYSKRLKAKQVSGYSSENKSEIFALELRAAKAATMSMLPFGSPQIIAETSSEDQEEEKDGKQQHQQMKGQIGEYIDDGEEEYDEEETENTKVTKRRIT